MDEWGCGLEREDKIRRGMKESNEEGNVTGKSKIKGHLRGCLVP